MSNLMENLPVNTNGYDLPTIFNSLENKATKHEMIRAFNSLTLTKIIERQYPTIGSLQKEHGHEIMERFTGILVNDLSLSFDKDLKTPQIEELSIEINNSLLRNLSLEALFVAFQDLKKSQVIGKLTINKVLKHLNDFMSKQSDMIMQNNYNKHLSHQFHDPIENRSSEKEKQLFRDAKKFMLNNSKIDKK